MIKDDQDRLMLSGAVKADMDQLSRLLPLHLTHAELAHRMAVPVKVAEKMLTLLGEDEMTLAQDVMAQNPRKVYDRPVDPYLMTWHFHNAMGLPVRRGPYTPSVSERLLRGRLMLEEFIEHIEDGLGLDFAFITDETGKVTIELEHHEGRMYDPVETADSLADITVIANGTALQCGIHLPSINYEVYCSNMTKLDADGKPIINVCTTLECVDHSTSTCAEPSHFINPALPAGKLLKPTTYVPANIRQVLDDDANYTTSKL